MNVIVSNRYAAMLSNLNIDLIKSINGEFQVDDLIAQFDNFFFNKMILDITAIVNYQDELVSMGIYNFTRNIDAIAYLVDNPNSYKDVAQFHMIGGNGGMMQNNMPQQQPMQQQNNNNNNNYNNNRNRNNGNEKTFINTSVAMPSLQGTRVIGIKDLTDHAGASTLIYMLKKQLSEHYRVLALELDKNDFLFFNDPEMKGTSSKELDSIIHNPVNNYDVILVDVNSSNEENNISEMLYLIEPSTLMLNKMVRRDRNIIEKIKGKKVILNRSLLDQNDVREFENEAGLSVFHCIPPLDDKMDKHRVLDELLNKLGFNKNRPVADSSRAARLFGIVKE